MNDDGEEEEAIIALGQLVNPNPESLWDFQHINEMSIHLVLLSDRWAFYAPRRQNRHQTRINYSSGEVGIYVGVNYQLMDGVWW